MATGGSVLLALIGFTATWAQHATAASERTLSAITTAQQLNLDADDQHEALRADLFAALLQQRGALGFDDVQAIRDDAGEHAATLRADDLALGAIHLPRAVAAKARALRVQQQAYADEVSRLISAAMVGREPSLTVFDRDFYDALGVQHGVFTDALVQEHKRASSADQRMRTIALSGIWAGVLLALTLLLAMFIAISRSILGVTRKLQNLLVDNESSAARGEFGRRVVDALDMSDDEEAAREVAGRALADVHPSLPMELLLADSSKAHLEQAAVHPTAGAPGCGVDTPFACVAVRRGAAVTFPDSQRLDACPKLREHAGSPLSAACVPVTFMGRAIGVLHATGPVGDEPDQETVERMTRLAAHAGARIGTLRATHQTQIHAATDNLTGLPNRRTLEDEVRSLLRAGRSFALGFADLDHFKLLNDTYGHEAGDRALRLFAKVLRNSTRDGDLLARWGGEEFVIVLPDRTGIEATEIFELLRVTLLDAVTTSEGASFTVSVGVTDSSAGRTVDEIVREADGALLAAKAKGRDCVVVAGPQTRSAIAPKAALA